MLSRWDNSIFSSPRIQCVRVRGCVCTSLNFRYRCRKGSNLHTTLQIICCWIATKNVELNMQLIVTAKWCAIPNRRYFMCTQRHMRAHIHWAGSLAFNRMPSESQQLCVLRLEWFLLDLAKVLWTECVVCVWVNVCVGNSNYSLAALKHEVFSMPLGIMRTLAVLRAPCCVRWKLVLAGGDYCICLAFIECPLSWFYN